MKKVLFSIMFVLICTIEAFSQNFCETESNFPNSLGNNSQKNTGLNFINTNGPFSVKVFFHIIRKTDGTGGQNVNILPNCLNILNNDFLVHNINFINGGYDFIDGFYNINDYYYNQLINTNNHNDAIDIYLLPPDSSYYGKASGIPGAAFALGGTPTFNGIQVSYPESHILSHEMGHCLGLFHTFHGSAAEPVAGTCPELVNGTNSETCGDFVIDTPADPIALSVQDLGTTCTWNNTTMRDANGQLYNPDETLIMSYSYPQCMQLFTNDQGQRMREHIATSAVLQNRVIPNDIFVQNEIFSTGQTNLIANNSITAGRSVTTGTVGDVIIGGAEVTFQAGNSITIMPGVELGSQFLATITPPSNKKSFIISKNNNEYSNFLNNTNWFVVLSSFDLDFGTIYESKIDTIINSKLYSKIKAFNFFIYQGQKTSSHNLFIREDLVNQRVYRYDPNNPINEILLYDFNLKEGDKLYNLSSFILEKIDMITIEGIKRRRYTFVNENSENVIWIEGIGNIANPFIPDAVATEHHKLICVKRNQNIVYEGGSFNGIDCSSNLSTVSNTEFQDVSIYPNPSNGIFTISLGEVPKSKVNIKIYDVLGKLVYSSITNKTIFEVNLPNIPSGIYLVKLQGENYDENVKFIK